MNAVRSRGALFRLPLALLIVAVVALPHARTVARAVAHRLGIVADRRAVPGQPLGRLQVQTMNGSTALIAPRDGRPLLVNVFATWCGPCRSEMPAFARLAPALERDGVDVVGIDQSESPGAVSQFATDFSLRYPLYIDANRSTATSLDARVIPTTIALDGSGVVRAIHVGPLDGPDLVAFVRDAYRAR